MSYLEELLDRAHRLAKIYNRYLMPCPYCVPKRLRWLKLTPEWGLEIKFSGKHGYVLKYDCITKELYGEDGEVDLNDERFREAVLWIEKLLLTAEREVEKYGRGRRWKFIRKLAEMYDGFIDV